MSSWALPSSMQIDSALPRIAPGLQKYCWLQEQLLKRDVSSDPEYQRRFVGFYRVRRELAWRESFFELLESRKTQGLQFSEGLRRLADATGRIEASFASKLVASIDPDQPVIDSVVL